jgi:hypothetical protein
MMAKKTNVVIDDPVSRWVVARFGESQNYYKPLLDKFEDWDNQYFAISEGTKYTWQSNVFVPATYKAIKTLLARIVAALFSTNPPFDVVGVEEKDKLGEIPIKNLVSYQFDKTYIFDKFVVFILQALIRGTSIGKVFWNKKYAFVPREVDYEEEILVSVDEEGNPLKEGETRKTTQTKKKTVYDEKLIYEGPDFEVIDIYGGFYPDPYAVDIRDSYAIHRIVRTEDYLKKNRKHYDNIDKALLTEYPGDADWSHSRLENLGLIEPESNVKTSEENETKTEDALSKYELLECHCKFDINNDGKLEDSIITVCNRSVVIKKKINPYPDGCFVKIGFMPVLNEFFWQGVCELTEQLQTELNDKTNQRLDNVNLCLQKILCFVEDAVDTQIIKNFVFAPGARLAVKDLNAIKWESPDDVTASAYAETTLLKQEIQEVSGAVSVLMPSSNQSDIHRTASGLFMLKGEAETSIKLIVQMIENMGLAEIAKKYDLMNKLFMTKPLTIRILGEKGYQYPTINAEDVRWYNCDFVFKGASAYVNREIRLAQLTKFMDIVAKVPMIAMQFDPGKLVKMIANTLGFQEEELMRTKMQPAIQQAGLEPQLNTQGMGGQMGDVGYAPGGNDALQQMVNQGLPLEQIAGIMEKFQANA